jgi:plastocyanin
MEAHMRLNFSASLLTHPLITALLLTSSLLTGVGEGRAEESATVAIDNFTFAPASLKIKAGSRVVFVNHDDIPHNVVGETIKFRSKPLDTGESFSFVFDRPGEIVYFCGLHPQMKGKLLVTP